MSIAAASDIEDLKRANDRLTAAYVKVHRAAGKEKLARPLLDDHLRRQTQALRDAYLHAAETVYPLRADQEWLTQEADALQRLETTFRWRWGVGRVAGGATMVFGIPGVIGLLSATGISASALALLNECLCQLISVVPTFVSIAIYLTFCSAFSEKQKLLRDTDTGLKDGIYGAEDAVFGALHVDKERERPVDLQGWLLITGVWILALLFQEAAKSRYIISDSRTLLFLLFLGGAVTMASVSLYRYWSQK